MFFWETKVCSILGTMVTEKQNSIKERLKRKTYMGVCRQVFKAIRVIKPRFPTTIIIKNPRNRRNRGSCSPGCSIRPAK